MLLCACSAEIIPGWLLAAVAVSASTSASASSSAVVGRALVLRGGVVVAWGLVYRAWGLLADRHVSWPCIVARLVAWLLVVSCVAAYAAPKFDIISVYGAIDASSLTAAMP